MASADALSARVPTFSLPADARVANATAVFAALSELMTEHSVLQVDGGDVTDADTATVQLLLAARNEALARGGKLTLAPQSTALTEAICAAGAQQLFAEAHP